MVGIINAPNTGCSGRAGLRPPRGTLPEDRDLRPGESCPIPPAAEPDRWPSLLFSHRIQFLEFIPGIRDGETPIDSCPAGVQFNFPSTNFTGADCLAGQPAIQTLFSQNRDFNFSHVQPAAMFQRIVILQFLGEVMSLLR